MATFFTLKYTPVLSIKNNLYIGVFLLPIFYVNSFLSVSPVSPQKLDRFVGDSAVLPCRYDKQLEDLTAHWRYNDIKNVYDIQEGKGSTKEQHPDYTGRTLTFSPEFINGDFTLKLKNLQLTDSGTYCCYVIDVSFQQCTDLSVQGMMKQKRNVVKTNVLIAAPY